MASCLNQNRMSGYLVRSPRLGYTKTDRTPVFNGRIKVVRYLKVGDEWQEILIGYLDVVMFGRNAEELCGKLGKGDKIKTEGGLATRPRKKYEKDRKTVVTYKDGSPVEYPEVYIKADSVELEEKAGSRSNESPAEQEVDATSKAPVAAQESSPPSGS